MTSKMTFLACLTICILASSADLAQATLSLFLRPDQSDLNSLSVGDTFTVDIVVDGLVAGDVASFLAATVEFDGAILGSPSFVSARIVPDPTNLFVVESPGLFDAFYDSTLAAANAPINSNGTFSSFEVVATRTGTTGIGLTFVDALGTNVPGASIVGSPLSVSVVPEPSGFILIGLVGLLTIGCVWIRKRRKSRN